MQESLKVVYAFTEQRIYFFYKNQENYIEPGVLFSYNLRLKLSLFCYVFILGISKNSLNEFINKQ